MEKTVSIKLEKSLRDWLELGRPNGLEKNNCAQMVRIEQPLTVISWQIVVFIGLLFEYKGIISFLIYF